MKTMQFKRFAPVLALCALSAPGLASDFGTAGAMKGWAIQSCGVTLQEQQKGACDPPPVSEELPPAERSAAHLARAQRLMLFARMPEATTELDAAIRANPKNVEALVFAGRWAFTNGSVDKADVKIDAALLLAPDNAPALATRAMLLRSREQYDRAMADIDKAIAAAPDDTDMRLIRARILMDIDQTRRAFDDLGHALSLEPTNVRARTLRVDLLLASGRYEDAVRDLGGLIAVQPRNQDLLQKRAAARLNLGDEAGALADLTTVFDVPERLRKAMLRHEPFRTVALQRAVLLVRLQRTDEGMQMVDEIIATDAVPGILRLQIFLRSAGFSEIPVDGKRSEDFDRAVRSCFVDSVCGRSLLKKA